MVTKRILLAAAALAVLPGVVFAQPILRVDQIADVQGIRTACGGAGLEDQQRMSAKGYPVILKVVGANGQWLGEEHLTISGNGQNFGLQCEGPWVAMQLPPGRYCATAELGGAAPKTVNFTVGAGSRDVLIRFPEVTESHTQQSDQTNSSI